jgi:hypothetical protein
LQYLHLLLTTPSQIIGAQQSLFLSQRAVAGKQARHLPP